MEQTAYQSSAATATVPAVSQPTNAPVMHDSIAIQRLLDEVRYETSSSATGAMAYNRQHNRHNR